MTQTLARSFILLTLGLPSHAFSDTKTLTISKPAIVSTIQMDDLEPNPNLSDPVRQLITSTLALTEQKLTYTFGSSDPKLGGMDCSGTIYRLLQNQGLLEAPRQSDELCLWVKDKGVLHLTPNVEKLSDQAFAELKPGDLLFWTGTYATTERKLPVSHVMLYLGKLKAGGRPVMFGASDGRRFAGKSQCGVSVFDFELPTKGGKAAFYGYGAIPGLKTLVGEKPVPPPQVKPSPTPPP